MGTSNRAWKNAKARTADCRWQRIERMKSGLLSHALGAPPSLAAGQAQPAPHERRSDTKAGTADCRWQRIERMKSGLLSSAACCVLRVPFRHATRNTQHTAVAHCHLRARVLAQQSDAVAAADADAADKARGIRSAADPADQSRGIPNADAANRARGIRSTPDPADQTRGIPNANSANGARGIRTSSTYHDVASFEKCKPKSWSRSYTEVARRDMENARALSPCLSVIPSVQLRANLTIDR